jgi:hypothetical protein
MENIHESPKEKSLNERIIDAFSSDAKALSPKEIKERQDMIFVGSNNTKDLSLRGGLVKNIIMDQTWVICTNLLILLTNSSIRQEPLPEVLFMVGRM